MIEGIVNISRLDPKIGILVVKSLKKIIFTNNIGFGIQREHEKIWSSDEMCVKSFYFPIL